MSDAFIWPVFSKPSWLVDAVLHRGWEGEKPKKSVPLGRGSYSEWTVARFMINRGRVKDRVKVCLGDRASEKQTHSDVKEVRRINCNPIEKEIIIFSFFLLSQTNGPNSVSLFYWNPFGQKKRRTVLMWSSTVHELFLSDLCVDTSYHLLEHYQNLSKTPPIKQQASFPWKTPCVRRMHFLFLTVSVKNILISFQ